LLLDCGDGREEYLEILFALLEKEKVEKLNVVVTHSHLDHVGGLVAILERQMPASRLISFTDGQIFKFDSTESKHLEAEDCSKVYRKDRIKDTTAGPGQHTIEAPPNPREIQGFHTPGHKDDHFVFVYGDVLFSGDCVLGDGSSTTFNDLSQYMKSLERVLSLVHRFSCIVRGR